MVSRSATIFTLVLAALVCTSHGSPFSLLSKVTSTVSSATSAVTSAATSAVSSTVSAATSVVNSTVSAATSAVNSTVSAATSAVNSTVSTVASAVNSTVSTATSAVSSVASTIEKATTANYYTFKYAWELYSKCYRSCLMYLMDEEKRTACAEERETYCTKVKSYSLKELLAVYATKTAASSVTSSVTSKLLG